MKNSIIILVALFFVTACSTQKKVTANTVEEQTSAPQSNAYFQKMGEALGQFAQCKNSQDFNKLSNQFVVISKVETKEWLPLYYAAQCKIIASFITEDATEKDMYLEQTRQWFEQMEKLAPAESEIFALKALYYTAALTVNPMVRGQEYSMLSNKAASKALGMNKDNPRAKYILLANKIGFAQFFGKEITEECKEAEALLENWDTYKVASPIHPKWGKDRVEAIVEDCKK